MVSVDRRQFLSVAAAATVSSGLLMGRSAQAEESSKPRRRIFALGGGGMQPTDHRHLLLNFILSLTGKKNPLICYLPTAGGDQPDAIVKWYELTQDLACRPRHLKLISNSSNLKNLESQMLSMDAFFVGGGNTLNMLAIWKAQAVDRLLRKAWEQGIVLSGGSAGMDCWFERGVSDSLPGPLSAVEGLGFLKGSVCPHYGHTNRDGQHDRQEAYERLLLAGKIKDGYACEDDVGLLYEDDKLVRIVSDRPTAKAYFVRKSGDKILSEALKVDYLGEKT